MTNIKATKRALLSSTLALFLCFAMLLGTTFAWFTDSVTSANNIIKAGNLDIKLDYAKEMNDADELVWNEVTGDPVFDTNALWEPGRVEVVYLKVSNIGSLALQYQLRVNINDEKAGINMDGEEFKLSENLVFKVVETGATPKTFDRNAAIAVDAAYEQSLVQYNNTETELAVDGIHYIALIVYMPEDVGNEANYRGDAVPTIDLGINLYATQVREESDSFGDDYDANADMIDAILAEGGEIIMAGTHTEKMVVSEGADVTINLGDGNVLANTLVNNGTVTVNGGSINVNKVGIETYGDATITNVEMNAGSAGDYSNIIHSNSNTVYNNVNVNANGGGIAVSDGGKVEFNSGSVSVGSASTSGRYNFYVIGEGSEATINGGTFSFSKTNKRAYVYVGAGATVYIKGGTFGEASTREGYTAGIVGAGDVIITGGTFGFDPTNWVASGYEAIKAGKNWYVVPETFDDVAVSATDLKAKLENATSDSKIVLVADIAGDVVAAQTPGVEFVIDGNGHKFSGVLTVDGKSATATTAGIVIKNVNFVADSINADACIQLGDGTTATRYTCNVTVENCTFDVPGAVGVKSYTGGDKNVTIKNCVATANAHSLAQLKGVDGVVIEDCEVYSKNGINFNNSNNVKVNNCTFDVKGYAVRFGESANTTVETYAITNSTLKSACNDGDAVIVFRAGATNATVTFTNNTVEGALQMKGNENVTFVG